MKVMLKSADVLADLAAPPRRRQRRSLALPRPCQGARGARKRRTAAAQRAAAPVAAAKPAAAPAAAPAPTDDSGFQPIPFSFDDDFGTPPPAKETFDVTFKPRRELYAKGNEARC